MLKARIKESHLSDQSEVYAVRVTGAGFVLHFDMADYRAAINFASMIENSDIVHAQIFSVTTALHADLKPL